MPLDYLALLAHLQDRFERGIGSVAEDAAVPGCGDWTVRDLVEHLAWVHHWAAAMARDEDAVALPRHPADLVGRYAECAAELRETLATLPPDAPARTLNGPGPASFWHRRQVHETLVHLHDLLGSADDVSAEVWADAVDEVVAVMYPRQVRLDRIAPLADPLRLVATDTGREWRLGDDEPTAQIAGTAQTLTLLLWGRLGVEASEVTGDEDVVRRALATAITP
ncbi:maleylpyruvate isomerase family mycothiol-dependent enzyme [Nocardioides sp.]|uniref:maleylpyruvate isomerase family mycothiol-dependent enzyme n=1 Tax=Nocardioides sp. TaxID=35761 RepID=UPI0039E44614